MSLRDDECQYCGFRFVERSKLNAAFAMLANFNPGSDEFTAALDVLRNHIAAPALAVGGEAVAGYADMRELVELGNATIWRDPRDSSFTPLFTHPAGAVQVTDEMNRDVEMAQLWIDRYAAGIDDDLQMDRVIEALCPPVVVTDDMVERAMRSWYREYFRPIAAFHPDDFDRARVALESALNPGGSRE